MDFFAIINAVIKLPP